MNHKNYITVNGNEAAARIAYKTNEVCAIYPITPASGMSELAEEWSADQKENIYGSVPTVFEMQSEAGVAGALHGALQTGALSTTFTASQGLLLMLPNMYKIAAELTPGVIHVATRSVATHALSVFGDHSDVMAVRNTGYALLGAASVQEAMDFALISQASSLESRIPFVHFFDGFRTSHEISKIEVVSDAAIREMIRDDLVVEHRNRSLNPNRPVIRGTSQGADVFFQSREAVNTYYNACPDTVQQQMDKFAALTGRQYRLFDYAGHPEAEQVLIAMASACETIEESIRNLNTRGEKIGLIKVRLFRPFSTTHLINALPDTCTSIAVLDRTKEPGSTGEPLYMDVVQSLVGQISDRLAGPFPKVIGGRYGLASKEFTPAMVEGIVANLKCSQPKKNFTIGITDDITSLSLDYDGSLPSGSDHFQALFYQTRTQRSVVDFNNILKYLGSDHFIQGYTEINYKKSNAREVGNLRIGSEAIKAPYLVSKADIVVCDSINFVQKDNVLDRIRQGGKLLVASNVSNDQFWKELASDKQEDIRAKNIDIYLINPGLTGELFVLGTLPFSRLYAGFLTLQEPLVQDDCLEEIKNHIAKIDLARGNQLNGIKREETTDFAESILGMLVANKGDELPVSAFPVDGTYPTDTSRFNDNGTGGWLPIWDPDACTQCGACSLACPQGVIRMKVFEDDRLSDAPAGFKSTKSLEIVGKVDLLNYTLQANPEQCTSCNNCLDVCPSKALKMTERSSVLDAEEANWEHFRAIPEFDRTKIDVTKVSQQQLQEPLFKYSPGVDGCGEAPYLKLVSQLFGDRMLVANATGASSIFGGALPTTPWSKNNTGQGPAWSNSLFEDNAEFGLGFRLSLDQQELLAKDLLRKLRHFLDIELANDLMTAEQHNEQGIREQRERVDLLKKKLQGIDTPEAKQLGSVADSLVKKSVWIVGGDGWAYDIGYGGLDHVLASGKNVNILVLDNEVYSNTGGQMSKATPMGASAKFAVNGKQKQKKDLGLMAMTYRNVYVASVAIGANQDHTLKAFLEAEKFNGPSLIIAYCHSPSHGIDMKNPSQYQKAAVASGQWLLYRNDPRRVLKDLNPLQLDSVAPKLPVEDYLMMENRFEPLFKTKNDGSEHRRHQVQQHVDDRFDRYVSMSKPRDSKNEKRIQDAKKEVLAKSNHTGLSQIKKLTTRLLMFLVLGTQLLFSISPDSRLKEVDTLNQLHPPAPLERRAGTPFYQKQYFPILSFSGSFKEKIQAPGLSEFNKFMRKPSIADLAYPSNSFSGTIQF